MLRKIEFENFMSLRRTVVELDPLTVFVGPNGSGKSAIFKGLVTLSKLLNGAPLRSESGEFLLEAGVALDELVWNANTGLPVRFRVWFDDDGDEPSYTLELTRGAPGWSVTHEKIRSEEGWIEVAADRPFRHPTERGDKVHRPPLRATLRYLVHPFLNDSVARPSIEPILQIAGRFGEAWRYRPSASDIASYVGYPTETGPGKRSSIYVRENGYGVAAKLQELQGSKRDIFETIEKSVHELFPHVSAIGFKTDWHGVRLSFRTDRSPELIPAPQESDGVLLATFLFWRLYTANASLKVCLEEPESGLHPFLLAERFRVLKMFAYGEQGPGMQLLVATHSPEFLRALKTHPGALIREIRIVDFSQESGTRVRRPSYYRDVANLIEEYEVEIQKRWQPVIQGWAEANEP